MLGKHTFGKPNVTPIRYKIKQITLKLSRVN